MKPDLTDVYAQLGVAQDNLGCIMLKVEPLKVSDIIADEDLYQTGDPNKYWLNGIVSEDFAHCTLLFGLMESGQAWRSYVDKALEGWSLDSVTVDEVNFFESSYMEENYFCIVAKLIMSPELVDGNARLRRLPHIDGFSSYIAHITLAYIKNDPDIRDTAIYALNNRFLGKKLATQGLDYGK